MRSLRKSAEKLGIESGDVSVRSDATAAGFLKANQAIAATLDASTIIVRPESAGDPEVLAHELMHVAQLRRGAPGDRGEAERNADDGAAALREGATPPVGAAAAPPLFLHFTGHAFDQALDNAHVPDGALRLLTRSPTFLKTVRTLDAHYVSLDDSKASYHLDDRGFISDGAFKGKRRLYAQGGAAGSLFAPFNAIDNLLSADVIKLETAQSDIELALSIAHEATHALHYVTSGSSATSKGDPLSAAIDEEIGTRTAEIGMGREMFKKGSEGRGAVDAQVADHYLERPFVERDIAPGVGLTYLESAGFEMLLHEAQAADGLSDQEALTMREDIDRGPKHFPTIKNARGFEDPSTYAEVYLDRKVAIADWETFTKDHEGGHSPETTAAKELIIKDHAKYLLKARITYTPLPVS